MTETLQGNSGPNTDQDDATNVDATGPSTPSSRSEASTPSENDNAPNDAATAAAAPLSQSKVRRSSLRPAPADYRPSVRDPSMVRPMMVVRAGDAVPATAHADPIAGEQGETRPLPEAAIKDDAFASAKQSAASASTEEPSLAIPLAPAVPIDLVPKSDRQGRNSEPRVADLGTSTSSRHLGAPTSNSVPATGAGREPQRAGTAESTGNSEPKRGSRSPLAIALVAVTVAAVALVMKHGTNNQQQRTTRTPMASESLPGAPRSLASEHVVPAQGDVNQKAGVAETIVDQVPAAASASVGQRNVPVPASASAALEAPVASAPAPGTTRVRLELRPIDAKVHFRGREIPGPPYEFDIGKDQRIAVEVVRFGFVTAKVVLDDKKPVVSYGMLRERWRKGN